MKKMIFTTAMIFLFSAGISFAQNATPGVGGRQVRQHARINEGTRSGELTRPEARRLRNEQRKIQIEKKMAKADGKVTPSERRFLRHEQRKANRHIHRQKNDAQQR
ncbi:MAG: hypothetical protein U0T82_12935 [Bacteroidales bacterium]